MALLNAIGDAIKPRSSANLPDPILRFPRRGRHSRALVDGAASLSHSPYASLLRGALANSATATIIGARASRASAS